MLKVVSGEGNPLDIVREALAASVFQWPQHMRTLASQY